MYNQEGFLHKKREQTGQTSANYLGELIDRTFQVTMFRGLDTKGYCRDRIPWQLQNCRTPPLPSRLHQAPHLS